MNPSKKEAIEFCLNKYVTNKMVDIWLTVILTLGLAVLIFPILLWLIYRYVKAKKEVKRLKEKLNSDPRNFKKVEGSIGYGYSVNFGSVENSTVLLIDGKEFDIPQLYIWFSKYKTKERLAEILNSQIDPELQKVTEGDNSELNKKKNVEEILKLMLLGYVNDQFDFYKKMDNLHLVNVFSNEIYRNYENRNN